MKNNRPASEKMRIIHDTKRPMLSDYIETLFDDFIELHGDRYFADDHAIMAGIGWLNGTEKLCEQRMATFVLGDLSSL